MRKKAVCAWVALQLFACTSEIRPQILGVSPSAATTDELPLVLHIEGEGLSGGIGLSVDNHDPAQTTPPEIRLGDLLLPIVSHASVEQIDVQVDGLLPGSYDLSWFAQGRSATRAAAFVVLSANRTIADSGISSFSATSGVSSTALRSATAPSLSTTALESTASSEALSSNPSASAASDASLLMTNSAGVDADAPNTDGGDSGIDLSGDSGVDASETDAGVTAVDAAAPQCLEASLLFSNDYESGDFASWTSADVSNVSCQQTSITGDNPYAGTSAFTSEVSCASGSDHEKYGALQFSGDTVLGTHVNSGTGIDAPFGIIISFWAWADIGFATGQGDWLSFLLLSGPCDWTDDVFSVGTGNSSDRLAISHSEVDGGTSSDYAGAPSFPQQTWAHVTVYINYYDSEFTVWQDGVAVTHADFVRPGLTLCHIRLGAYVSSTADQVLMYMDNTSVWHLQAPLADTSVEPCLAEIP